MNTNPKFELWSCVEESTSDDPKVKIENSRKKKKKMKKINKKIKKKPITHYTKVPFFPFYLSSLIFYIIKHLSFFISVLGFASSHLSFTHLVTISEKREKWVYLNKKKKKISNIGFLHINKEEEG